jgi:hypothetical protein
MKSYVVALSLILMPTVACQKSGPTYAEALAVYNGEVKRLEDLEESEKELRQRISEISDRVIERSGGKASELSEESIDLQLEISELERRGEEVPTSLRDAAAAAKKRELDYFAEVQEKINKETASEEDFLHKCTAECSRQLERVRRAREELDAAEGKR